MNIIFLSSLSAIFLILIVPPFSLGLLAYIALVPLLIGLNKLSISRWAFFIGLLVGIISYSGLFYWLCLFKIWVFLTIVGILSIFMALFCYFTKVIWKRSKNPYLIILFPPFFWITLQYLYNITPLGIGSFWANLGYTQIKYLNFIQIIDITGIYFITFLIVGINSIISFCFNPYFRKSTFKLGIVFLGFIFLNYSYSFFINTKPEKPKEIKAACIQANFYQSWQWRKSHVKEILKTYSRLTNEAKKRFNPEFILWAEYAIPTDIIHEHTEYYKYISELAKKVKTYLVLSSLTYEKERMYNIVLVFSPEGELVSKIGKQNHTIHRKILPVPFGESQISSGYDYSPFNTELGKLGVIICYEDTFSQIATKMCKLGTEYLFFLANDGHFRNTTEPRLHAMMSTFRAIENRRFVVRVANTGITKVIDPSGISIKNTIYYPDKNITFKDIEATRNTQQILLTKIKPSSKLTFYTQYGDIFIFLCLFITIGILLLTLRQK
ncbi:MAG: nitrilase-related carbon-nitrogen hydrolase [bacterium]